MSKKGDKNTDELIDKRMKDLQKNMELLLKDNKDIKLKVDEAIEATKFISDKYDENENNMKEIKRQLIEIKNQNKTIMERNEALEKQLKLEKKERIELEERFFNIITPIELERRQNNLELHGLKEENEENCETVVKSIISKVTSSPVTITKCYRFGKKETHNGKPRRVLIQFANKEQRDDVYKNKMNLKKLKEPMYINENLPRHLSILRGKANGIRKERNYKYIWMKNGTILLRKDDFEEVISVRVSSDLTKII